MNADIDQVFQQILEIRNRDFTAERRPIKDAFFSLEEQNDCGVRLSMWEAYSYLHESLLLDTSFTTDKENLLSLFCVHKYLTQVYWSSPEALEETVERESAERATPVLSECFIVFRMAGAFSDIIAQYRVLRESELWDQLEPGLKSAAMKECAKAYRNTGEFNSALDLYFECLRCSPKEDWPQKGGLFLKIGKIYSNYLMQLKLARFYLEEAERIFEWKAEVVSEGRARKNREICYDALGQIYREEGEFERAEAYFDKAVSLNPGRTCRAAIHKIFIRYKEDPSAKPQSKLLSDIETLSAIILSLAERTVDEVGIGIRSIQLGDLLERYVSAQEDGARYLNGEIVKRLKEMVFRSFPGPGEYAGVSETTRMAVAFIRHGRSVAIEYNEMKTVVRSFRAEAKIARSSGEPELYESCMSQAKKLACKNHLFLMENEVIKEMIAGNLDDKSELLRRRKDIYKGLVDFSKTSIARAVENSSLFFSQNALMRLYPIILDDFSVIFSELDQIIDQLDVEFKKQNQRSSAYLEAEIGGKIYQDILHNIKNDVQNAEVLKRLIEEADRLESRYPAEGELLFRIRRELAKYSNVMARIHETYNEKWGAAAEDKRWFSLDELIRGGVSNYAVLKPQYKTRIEFPGGDDRAEVHVHGAIFKSNISEIIENAFSFLEEPDGGGSPAAEVPLLRDGGAMFRIDYALDEEKAALILRCCTIFTVKELAEEAFLSIQNVYEGRGTTKGGGHGYGFQSLKVLFNGLLHGSIRPYRREEPNQAGLEIRLKVNGIDVRLKGGGDFGV